MEKCIKIGQRADNLKEKLLTLDDKVGTNTFLLEAVKSGKTNVINELISHGANITEEQYSDLNANNIEALGDSDYFPWTLPLHYALYHGESVSTRFLLKHLTPGNILQTNKLGFGVLHAAADGCKCEDYDQIKYICKHVKAIQIVFKYAKENEMGDILMNQEAQTPKKSPLLQKVINLRGMGLLRLYLSKNLIPDINQRFSGGETALHFTAKNSNLEALKLLIKHNADIKLRDDKGYSAFHTAILWNHASIVKHLLTVIKDSDIINAKVRMELVPKVDDYVHASLPEECPAVTLENVKSNASVVNENDVHLQIDNTSPTNERPVCDFKPNDITKITKNNVFTPIQMAVALQNWNVLKVLVTTNSSLDKYSETIQENVTILSMCRSFKYHPKHYFIMLAILAPIARDINERVCPGKETVINFAISKRNPQLIDSACRNPNLKLEGLCKSANPIQRIMSDKLISDACKSDYFIPLLENGVSPNMPIKFDGSDEQLAMWVALHSDKNTLIKVLLAGAHTEKKKWQNPLPGGPYNDLMDMTHRYTSLRFIQRRTHWQCLQKLIFVANCRLIRLHRCYQFDVWGCRGCNGLTKLPKLQNLARATIRNQLYKSKDIDELPLPKPLKEYLYLPELKEILKSS